MANIFSKERRGNPITIRMSDRQRELIQLLIDEEFATNQTELIHRALDLYVTRILSDLSDLADEKPRGKHSQLLHRLQQMLNAPEPESVVTV